ncbi:MAG: hypothetical protein VYA43_02580, partial [Pseudomonadota bacterium]|nr:hypothetical protein [Pseudomonadota bacterium]
MAPHREKIFEKVALKQRLDVMRKSRSLAVLREELQKTESLCEQLEGILKDIMVHTGERSVASLRADSWYRSNVLEQLKTLENRGQFLRAEIRDANRELAKARRKKTKAKHAAKIQKRLRLEKAEQKRESELPLRNQR